MQRFFDHIFAYYDSLLSIGSDEITKRLQMLLNNPQYGQKEGENSQFFSEITIKASPPIYIQTLRLLDRIGPVGRFGENPQSKFSNRLWSNKYCDLLVHASFTKFIGPL